MCNVDGARNSVDNEILDSARECVLEFGVRRTTLAEVARRSGKSRPTVYRRWADTTALVADLLTREVADAIPELRPQGTARETLVATIVEGARIIRAHPLFVKIKRTDPDLLQTYILQRLGTSQLALIARAQSAIDAGQHDGSIREGSSREMAAMLLLICQSSVQSCAMIEPFLSDSALDTELRIAVDHYLTAPKPRTTDESTA